MPFVQSASIRAVTRRLEQGASIAAPTFEGRRGHPVGFSHRWRKDLLALSGDTGAASILHDHPGSLVLTLCEDPGVLMDVDVHSDLPVR
jgi:molybdenum cofactor cytidylyltransferase